MPGVAARVGLVQASLKLLFCRRKDRVLHESGREEEGRSAYRSSEIFWQEQQEQEQHWLCELPTKRPATQGCNKLQEGVHAPTLRHNHSPC